MIGLLGLAALGCSRNETPAPTPATSSAPMAPAASRAPPVLQSATATPAPEDAGADVQVAPVGGNWLRCYAGFRPRTDPKLDVLRLGLACGPSNGMRKVADVQEAKLRDGGPGREHRWTAEPGDCYRIFAVGEPSVEDLDVEVLSPRGRRIAFDTSDDRWPVVKPDGPFCVAEGGEYRARVHAQRGAGSYAIEIWRLR